MYAVYCIVDLFVEIRAACFLAHQYMLIHRYSHTSTSTSSSELIYSLCAVVFLACSLFAFYLFIFIHRPTTARKVKKKKIGSLQLYKTEKKHKVLDFLVIILVQYVRISCSTVFQPLLEMNNKIVLNNKFTV